MSSMNNTGDYVEALIQFVTEKVEGKAVVVEEGDEPENPTTPLIIVSMPKILETGWSDDGRHEDVLGVTLVAKVPKSIDKPNVTAVNTGGFLRYLLADREINSGFVDYNNIDLPADVEGDSVLWKERDKAAKANFFGYMITFIQTVRYGTEENPAFVLPESEIKDLAG